MATETEGGGGGGGEVGGKPGGKQNLGERRKWAGIKETGSSERLPLSVDKTIKHGLNFFCR